MGLFDNYKIKALLKKSKAISTKREICILPIEAYHSILIVQNEENPELKSKIESLFTNSKVTLLTSRKTKESLESKNNYIYTYHVSDLGFGKIANDKLIGLINTNFDLVIDFSDKITEFNYFVKCAKASLKIGYLHSTKNYLYDLLVEKGTTDSDYIENIKLQINTLSQ